MTDRMFATRTFGPFRGQLVELSVVDHDDNPLPDGMATVTLLVPLDDARIAAQAMFLWGQVQITVTTEQPVDPEQHQLELEQLRRFPPSGEQEEP